MRKMGYLLIAALALPLAGCGMFCGGFGTTITGSGKVISKSVDIAGVTAVSLRGIGHVLIEQTGTESLTLTADENLLPYLTAEVQGAELVLGVKGNVNLKPSRDIVYKLTVKRLDELDISGSGKVEAKGIDARQLKATISGAGDLRAEGRAESQEVSISGAGNFLGENLKGDSAAVDISGSGHATMAVSTKLDVDVSGAGSVEYVGDPAVTKRVSGVGSVRKR